MLRSRTERCWLRNYLNSPRKHNCESIKVKIPAKKSSVRKFNKKNATYKEVISCFESPLCIGNFLPSNRINDGISIKSKYYILAHNRTVGQGTNTTNTTNRESKIVRMIVSRIWHCGQITNRSQKHRRRIVN